MYLLLTLLALAAVSYMWYRTDKKLRECEDDFYDHEIHYFTDQHK